MAHSSGIRLTRRFVVSSIAALVLTAPLVAQGPGVGGGGGGTGGGGGLGGGGGAGGGAGGGRPGGGGLGGGGGGAGVLNTLGTGAVGGRTTGGGTTAPAASNFLSGYFSYPYVTALPPVDSGAAQRTESLRSAVTHTISPYGSQTFTGTTGAGRTGAAGRGSATIRGGNQMGGQNSLNGFDANPPGATAPRLPRYSTAIRFQTNPVSSERIAADVRDVIGRSTRLPSKDQVTVDVSGRNVTLRGSVSSDDERRQFEALVRMTPGVGAITNELIAPE